MHIVTAVISLQYHKLDTVASTMVSPCGMGVRIQPTPALRRVVGDDYLRDMSYPLPPAHCMLGLLACNGAYELG